MDLTWFNSNSWMIDIGGKRILLDPWLVGSLVFGNLPWLFKGEQTTSYPIPEHIDLILLSQGLEDHSHTPTLEQLDPNIPVVGSPNAAKVVEKLGFTQVTSLSHGETFTLSNQVEIKAVPGSPIGPQLVENGYLLKEFESGNTIYYEPHGFHSPLIQEAAPIDVVITPLIDLKLPLLGSIIKGQKSALQLCQWLRPQVILPTAESGDVIYKGLLNSLLSIAGSTEEFSSLLKVNNLAIRVIEPKPGEMFTLELDEQSSI